MARIPYILLLFGLVTTCKTQTVDDVRALSSNLLANYSRIVKPKRNQSEPVHVSIAIQLLSILQFDEIQEKLSVIAVTYLSWKDELMCWRPENYGGLETVDFESNQVWTPMFVLVNTAQDVKKIGHKDDWLYVNYKYNGSAQFYPGGILSAKCDVDVTYFPFDCHKCRFQFSTWAAGTSYMNITVSEHVLLSFYKPSGKWKLVNTVIVTELENHLFDLYLVLARKPRFVIINVILPIVMLAIISTIVFYIPIDSGERIAYSITMLLAIGVFLTLVGDNLPKTSNPMSIFSYYLLSMLIVNILITVVNIFSVKCYHICETQPVGSFWIRLFHYFRCKTVRSKREKYGPKRQTNTSLESLTSTTNSQQRQSMNAKLTNNTTTKATSFTNGRPGTKKSELDKKMRFSKPGIVTNRSDMHEDIDDEKEDVTWRDVSGTIDKISLIVSILLILILTIVFFLIIWIGGIKSASNFNSLLD